MGQNVSKKENKPSTKWTPEIGDKLVQYLEQGRFKAHAAAMCGIDRTTLYNWIEWSEKGEHPDWEGFDTFYIRVENAHAVYCQRAEDELSRLAAAGKNPDWRGQAFLLERKFPSLYGEQAKQIELSGKVDIGIPDIQRAIRQAKAEKEKDNGTDSE